MGLWDKMALPKGRRGPTIPRGSPELRAGLQLERKRMTTDWEDNIKALVLAQGKLVGKDPVPFVQRTTRLPQERGVYMFSDVEGPHICYAVGRSADLQTRLRDHWDGNDPQADLCGKLKTEGMAQDNRESRDWITKHVAVRWLTSDEIPMDDGYLEQFLIAVLRPRFNRPPGGTATR